MSTETLTRNGARPTMAALFFSEGVEMIPVFLPDCDCDCHESGDPAAALRLAREKTIEEIERLKAESEADAHRTRSRSARWFAVSIACMFVVLSLMTFMPDRFFPVAELIPLGFLLPAAFGWFVLTFVLLGGTRRTNGRFIRTCELAIELRKSAEHPIMSRSVDLGPSDGE